MAAEEIARILHIEQLAAICSNHFSLSQAICLISGQKTLCETVAVALKLLGLV